MENIDELTFTPSITIEWDTWEQTWVLNRVLQYSARAQRTMPEGYIDVSAEEFLEHPEDYGVEGSWIESSVVS